MPLSSPSNRARLRVLWGACCAACWVSAAFGQEADFLLVPPSPFEQALSTPEASTVVDVPMIDLPAPTREMPVEMGPLERRGSCPCPDCRAAARGTLPAQGACFRGTDRLGSLYGDWIGDGGAIERGATGSVLALHGTLDAAARIGEPLHDSSAGCWITSCNPYCCKLQCRFVNWRHGSMYLQGCLPEGYALGRFIDMVPQTELHDGPLFAAGPVEPTPIPSLSSGGTRSIRQVSLNITPPAGDLPGAKSAAESAEVASLTAETRVHVPGTHRDWCGTTFYWNASLLNHQPLYFEDVNLERHGYSYGPVKQPIVSGVKFFATLPALPYLMTAQPPHTSRYTLGESRPGSHAPYVHEFPPLNFDAAAVQAAAVTGLIFLIP